MADNVVSGGLIGTHVAAGTATTHIAASPQNGYLHAVVINTKGASANTLTLSDTNGTIAIIDTTANVGTIGYGCKFIGKLDAVSATGTGADYTVIWRRGI